MKTWSALLLLAAFIALSRCPPPPTMPSSRASMASTSSNPISTLPPPKWARSSPSIPAADRRRVLLQYVIENELMAGAARQTISTRPPTFPDRLKYHERRALRDAFFDVKNIRDASPRPTPRRSTTRRSTPEAGAGGARPPHSGGDRGRGERGRRAAEEGRGLRHRRQGEVERRQCRRAATSASSPAARC